LNDARATSWTEANQAYLVAAAAEVRAALERCAARPSGAAAEAPAPRPLPAMPDGLPAAVEVLCRVFALSRFERSVLLMCAGVDLDAGFARLCAALGDGGRPHPTFGLALAALPEPHWSALTPSGPLRRWNLIELVGPGAPPLTAAGLRINEWALHFLAGAPHLDERVAGLLAPVEPADDLVPSHQALARQLAAVWGGSTGRPPVVTLSGADEPSRRSVAAAGAAAAGVELFELAADAVPVGPEEFDQFIRLWQREAALSPVGLYVNAESIDPGDARVVGLVSRLVERAGGPAALSSRDRWRPSRRPGLALEVRKPSRAEQQSLWESLVGPAAGLNGHLPRLASQFDLNAPAIRQSVRDAVTAGTGGDLGPLLWDAGRAQARPQLDGLAQRVEPAAGWDDLVLPPAETRTLREIVDQVAHRATVYDAWGMGRAGGRGLGITALFCGTSGTGKTLAAEVVAGALRLDLYRVDLAGVVSKYIGETEKNLRRVFDAAEDGGAVLFFDEADALFGKRSEVRDSHDRYANIEINYLLQRMESYRGLAVLATNRRGDLDPAFLRRLRFVVNFPFPEAGQRSEIWRRMFPPATPTEGLDWEKLSRPALAGGNIRNVAVQAAFLAAAAGEPVRMRHLARATCSEFAKLEKPLTDAAIGGWQ
jgi:hypothetical protein